MRAELLDLLTAVVAAPSPSGYEGPVARIFRDHMEPIADEVRTDVTGNVIATLNPGARRMILLAGHMDEIGFIVHHIGEEGLLHQFHATGSATPTDARPIQVARGGVPAVLLGVPLRYMHTRGKVIALDDLEATARLMAAFCRRIRADTGSVQG